MGCIYMLKILAKHVVLLSMENGHRDFYETKPLSMWLTMKSSTFTFVHVIRCCGKF